MKTDDLIRELSQDTRRQPLFTPTTMVLLAAGVALMFALATSVVWLRPRADLVATVTGGNDVFLLKIAFALAIVFSALPMVRDLSVPGKRLGPWSLLAVVPFVTIGALALQESSGPHLRDAAHHADFASWLECLWQIPALSIPALAILFLAVRSLAPTNLRLIGGYIGLVAGGIGAVGYAFHCDHDSMAFIATFYSLAIFEMAILGALFGPRALRWTVSR
jgi:hypothetical protein